MSSQGADAHLPKSYDLIRGNPANLPDQPRAVKLVGWTRLASLLTVHIQHTPGVTGRCREKPIPERRCLGGWPQNHRPCRASRPLGAGRNIKQQRPSSQIGTRCLGTGRPPYRHRKAEPGAVARATPRDERSTCDNTAAFGRAIEPLLAHSVGQKWAYLPMRADVMNSTVWASGQCCPARNRPRNRRSFKLAHLQTGPPSNRPTSRRLASGRFVSRALPRRRRWSASPGATLGTGRAAGRQPSGRHLPR